MTRSLILILLVPFPLLCGPHAAICRADDLLEEVSRSIEGRARRASSGLYDPESNQDAYHIGPGKTVELTTLEGPGEIRHMWFTIAGHDRRYPRTLVLRIYWDGAKSPSVETPIGDFFAAGNGMRANVNSLPIQVTSYGRALNCYWRMPFRHAARIEMTNEGDNRLTVYWQFDWMQLPRVPEKMLYFHARYRQEFPARPFAPYVIFEGRGDGQYVGTVFSTQCSYASWFGESDDRFYIDGERAPSIVGTGCEDYFNDAWNLRLFSNANTGVTIKEPNGEDCRFTAYRWHIQAPVTFRKSLKVEIERRSFAALTDPSTGQRQLYDFKYRPDFCSSVAFWYQKNVAQPTWKFPAARQRINREIFLETSEMVPEITTSSGVTARRHSNRVANLKRGLYVDNPGVGGWFEVPCHVDKPGKYSISVFQVLYKTSGIWKVTMKGPNGDIVVDDAMDFYDPFLAWKENRPEHFLYGTWFEKKVGVHALEAGNYRVHFECVGSNPLSVGDEPGKRGMNCRLDGISLRWFPWQDLAGRMRRYLADEKALQTRQIERTQQTVARLAAAIEAFRRPNGDYPVSLGKLGVAAVQTRSAASGKIHSDVVAVDPWNQAYRYRCPGQFNPDSFDVYSVHGNSRDPSQWIGNWPSPYHIPGAVEGEALQSVGQSKGVHASTQAIGVASIPPLSGGKLLFIRLRAPGDSIDLAWPDSIFEGSYRLKIRFVTSWDYARLKVSFNGTAFDRTIDTYSPDVATRWVDLGRVSLRHGRNVVRLQAVGHDPRSSGFQAGVDAVLLTPGE